ncbi:type II toxin-antitoxin system RelE/ParE family toxin [Hymenobacter ruricola]|uniref:Type II toxin-antitoxin system RelE/ParE family toxin n=1 Tax=Hymenobacter ruricola TaxID=2791023 RepID=A0ABS0I153_9BACT|nr:type II toxin-antitoxin system RelE/ParE family toxin [Hymenobacter ruricola]MBF9220642.1 type II toxin-antitoxin system RelE/ParE family toxin [Hymenobacter ruricola]
MSFVVIASKRFNRLINRLQRKYYSIPEDFVALITELKANPTSGNALGRDCYKVRMRIDSKRTGKSGGARVVTCVKIVGEKIYLLTIYDKSEQDSITDQERDDLLRENGLL